MRAHSKHFAAISILMMMLAISIHTSTCLAAQAADKIRNRDKAAIESEVRQHLSKIGQLLPKDEHGKIQVHPSLVNQDVLDIFIETSGTIHEEFVLKAVYATGYGTKDASAVASAVAILKRYRRLLLPDYVEEIAGAIINTACMTESAEAVKTVAYALDGFYDKPYCQEACLAIQVTALHSKDANTVVCAADTIRKYNSHDYDPTGSACDALGVTADLTKDKQAIMRVAETIWKFYDSDENRYVCEAMAAVAYITDPQTLINVADALDKYTPTTIDYSTCRTIREVAVCTRDAQAVKDVADAIIQSTDQSFGNELYAMMTVAQCTHDAQTVSMVARTLTLYKDIADDLNLGNTIANAMITTKDASAIRAFSEALSQHKGNPNLKELIMEVRSTTGRTGDGEAVKQVIAQWSKKAKEGKK